MFNYKIKIHEKSFVLIGYVVNDCFYSCNEGKLSNSNDTANDDNVNLSVDTLQLAINLADSINILNISVIL